MPCQIRKPPKELVEPPGQTGARSARLQALVDGSWQGDDHLVLIYYDKTADLWKAWDDPDPLSEAGVTVAP
jgi:hypothetical protein